MKNISLNIESAGHRLGVAITQGQAVRSQAFLEGSHIAPKALSSLIESVFKEGALRRQDIDFVAVDIGPGSFTGLRAGIAMASGIAFGLGRPLFGISAFQILALTAKSEGQAFPLGILIDSRRAEPFAALMGDLDVFLEKPRILGEKEILSWKKKCENVLSDHPDLSDNWRFLDPVNLGRLALEERYRSAPQPVYLREPEITEAKKP